MPKDRILLDRADLSGRLRRLVEAAGSQQEFCDQQEGGLSPAYLSSVLNGAAPGKKILQAAGVRPVIRYEVIQDDH